MSQKLCVFWCCGFLYTIFLLRSADQFPVFPRGLSKAVFTLLLYKKLKTLKGSCKNNSPRRSFIHSFIQLLLTKHELCWSIRYAFWWAMLHEQMSNVSLGKCSRFILEVIKIMFLPFSINTKTILSVSECWILCYDEWITKENLVFWHMEISS